MLWILRALLGRWACPWCLPAKDTWWDRNVIDRLPHRLIIAMSPYDRWVGEVGIPWCLRHHSSRAAYPADPATQEGTRP